MEKKVRVRFAPSPTGALHIGGVRTALYNYLFAQKHKGTMILRIVDTDQARYVAGAEEYIINALKWCGIVPDEGPIVGGEYGPYRQSERKAMYMEYAQKLVADGKAYYAFDTSEELNEMRERLQAAKVDQPQYNSITRLTMNNSITLDAGEVERRLSSGDPYVIRIKVPKNEEIRLNDMIRGWVNVHSSTMDDKVIMKSDGMPTYHLANIVDDHLMGITHVIRGEEWLPSAPLHVLLYRFLGWEKSMPEFAHLPLLLKSDGVGKLSKRDADKHGFPIFPLEYTDPKTAEVAHGFKEKGCLPEAFVNFLALLGWNPGTEQEIFSLNELTEAFSIERVGKSGTKFDIQKANWFNQQYLKEMPSEELAESLLGRAEIGDISRENLIKVCDHMKVRITFTLDILKDGAFFFKAPDAYDEKVIKKRWTMEAVDLIAAFKEALASLDLCTSDHVKTLLDQILEEKGLGIGRVMPALRVAITGAGSGPDLMGIIEILGRDETIKRLGIALKTLEKNVK